MLLEDHKIAVKTFAEETLKSTWTPLLMSILKSKLPPPPPEEQEIKDAAQAESYRGLIALKLQVMKVLSHPLFLLIIQTHVP